MVQKQRLGKTPQNKGTAFEKHFLIFIDSNLFIKNERIQVSGVPDMPYQSISTYFNDINMCECLFKT